jgi:iron complex transport system permease protein
MRSKPKGKSSNQELNIRLNSDVRDERLVEAQKTHEKHAKRFSGVIKLLVALVVFYFVSLFFLLPYDLWSFDTAYLFETISSHFKGFCEVVFGIAPSSGMTGRICQCLGAVIAGAALASCGAVFQGSFRNVMAGPSTMGVMSGGMLGCLLYLLSPAYTVSSAAVTIVQYDPTAPAPTFLETYGLQLCIFFGCLLAVLLVLGISIAAGRGRVSAPAMILSGSVFSTIVGTFTSMIQYSMIVTNPDDERIDAIRDIMLGNFSKVGNFEALLMFLIPVAICLVVLMFLRGRLNALAFGEDEATTMGVNVMFYRVVMTLIGTVLTASVVAYCGQIGFLGFMVPLIGRKIAGPDMRYLLPTCICLGAIMLLGIYDVAYFFNMSDTLNVFTSMIGCCVMLFTLMGKKGGARSASFEGGNRAGMGAR